MKGVDKAHIFQQKYLIFYKQSSVLDQTLIQGEEIEGIYYNSIYIAHNYIGDFWVLAFKLCFNTIINQ